MVSKEKRDEAFEHIKPYLNDEDTEVIKSMLNKLDTMLEFDEGIDVSSIA